MTILTVADQVSPLLYEHFEQQQWREVDLILSCGDLPPGYLDFLCTSLGVPLVYVRGNHDHQYAPDAYDGLINAHGRIVECQGIRIAGFEGCRRYNQSGCQYSEADMRRVTHVSRIRALRGAPDIVLSHAPPRGCHDAHDLCHQGFTCLRKLIDVWQPAYFVHGHTHDYAGREPLTQVKDTRVLNAYPYHLVRLCLSDRKTAATRKGPAEAFGRAQKSRLSGR